jgi:short-subunit dehydrogenase
MCAKGSSMPDEIRLPSFRLDGRVAMVTGRTGIGAGIASGFAEAGADLVLVGRSLAPLEVTARRVESFGRKATIIVCDLTDRTEFAAPDCAPVVS